MKKNITILFMTFLLIITSILPVSGNLNVKIIKEIYEEYSSGSLDRWSEQEKLIASDGKEYDYFGISTSIDDNNTIIGAYHEEGYYDPNKTPGAAYIFKNESTGWVEEQKLVASDCEGHNNFGNAVSLDGDYALIGAFSDNNNKGAAYVFKKEGSGWVEMQKLVSSDGEVDDLFGVSVFIEDDYAFVGAYHDDERGAMYVFKREENNWSEWQKLVSSDGEAGDWFGVSVSVNEDRAVIGANCDDIEKGAAYIFKLYDDYWIEQQKLTASDGRNHDVFGTSVSLYGDYLFIGAPYDYWQEGTVYVFKHDGSNWSEWQILKGSTGHHYTLFGIDVSIDDDQAIVGEMYANIRGAAYIYRRTCLGWVEEQKLRASDGEEYDGFGIDVSINGDYTIIGAYEDENSNGYRAGSAYIFQKILSYIPYKPMIKGPQKVEREKEYTYLTCTSDPQNQQLYYQWDWGDGTTTEWLGPYNSDEITQATHIWKLRGHLPVKVKAKNTEGYESEWSDEYIVIVDNEPPIIKEFTGPTRVRIYVEQEFKIFVNDSHGDEIFLWIDWDHDPNDDWIGPFNSHEEITLYHTWTMIESGSIRVIAKDIFGAESEMVYHPIDASRNKGFFNGFFKNIITRFPILKHLFGL